MENKYKNLNFMQNISSEIINIFQDNPKLFYNSWRNIKYDPENKMIIIAVDPALNLNITKNSVSKFDKKLIKTTEIDFDEASRINKSDLFDIYSDMSYYLESMSA